MSFNESWGLVTKESEAMGVKALNIANIDYLKSIKFHLKRINDTK